MKKFFSLVLALVMALSLTTVAWGAPITNDTDLQNAINSGATEIVLGAGEFTVDLYNIAARDSLTITGQGAATKLNFKHGQVRIELFNSFTISNCTIGRMVDKSWGQLVFSTGKDGGVYTVSNCIFNGESTQGIYMNPANGNEKYVIEGCTFTGDFGIEGAITVQNNSEITTLTVSDDNVFNVDDDSEELTIHYHKSNLTLDSAVDETVLIKAGDGATATENFERAVASADAGDTFKLVENVDLTTLSNPVEITDPINIDDNGQTLVGLAAGSNITTDANGKITGGTFETLPDESLLADGVIFVGNSAEKSSKKTNTYDGLYAKSTNAGADVDPVAVEVVVTPAKAVKYDKTTGELEDWGIVEHVNITGDSTDYVFVNSVKEADVVLYKDADGKFVKFYLDAIETPDYVEGVVFNNFGDDCGEVDYDEDDGYDKKLKYFTIKGTGDVFVLVEEAEEYACDFYVMYNSKLVPVVETGLEKVAHKVVTESEDGDLVKVYCSACGTQAVKAPNMMSVPKGAELVDGTGAEIWYWPVVGGSVSTETKVESAATFDAGIAMYVGMSVMAAAGSAVVLKKRED